jgi:hypothetical protein
MVYKFFLLIKRTKIITIATTKRMWIKPPKVYDDTNPKSQSTIKIIAIVVSIFLILINYNLTIH